jgi:hypothetical protein
MEYLQTNLLHWHSARRTPNDIIGNLASSVSFQELLVATKREIKRVEDPEKSKRIFVDSYEIWLMELKTSIEKLIEEVNEAEKQILSRN